MAGMIYACGLKEEAGMCGEIFTGINRDRKTL